eukprot:TRINITY_DN17436_c0_g1_i2.p1 TRINITY_DN17436_c0_g1~~TRINITY_DN17436_c0_g1_i2.p1  ORF type:complete len:506 (+),score=100.99 TRINITY_DN17436_c0_g1_i2:76-1593(+)
MAAGIRLDGAMADVHFLLRGQLQDGHCGALDGAELAVVHQEFNNMTALPFSLKAPVSAASPCRGDPRRICDTVRFTLAQLVRCRAFVVQRVHAVCVGVRVVQRWWRAWLDRREGRLRDAVHAWREKEEKLRADARQRIAQEQQAHKRAKSESHRKEAQARLRVATADYAKYNTDDALRRRAVERLYAQRAAAYTGEILQWVALHKKNEKEVERNYRQLRRMIRSTWAGTDDSERAAVGLAYFESLITLRRTRASRPRLRFLRVPLKDLRAAADVIVAEVRKAEHQRGAPESAPAPPQAVPPGCLPPRAAASPPKRQPPAGAAPQQHLPPLRNAPRVTPAATLPGTAHAVEDAPAAVNLAALRGAFSAATVSTIEEHFKQCDRNHDGSLGRDEMVSFLEGLYSATGAPLPCDEALRREVVEVFRRSDVDRSGHLSPAELVEYLPRSHFRRTLVGSRGRHRAPSVTELPGLQRPAAAQRARRLRAQLEPEDGGDELGEELQNILHRR